MKRLLSQFLTELYFLINSHMTGWILRLDDTEQEGGNRE